jgi:2-phosphosulfolactate phosphatase
MSGATALVVDVLRATTTLTHAFANGLTGVTACATIDEARAAHARDRATLLGGEREGVKVEGFDFGNSPAEYTAERVRGKRLVFVTSNGTRAIRRARGARRVLAAFVNAAAAVDLAAQASQVVILCAGREGRFSLEDAACAGLLAQRLRERGFEPTGAGASVALELAPANAEEVRLLLLGADHGRRLLRMGGEYARDVERCAALDTIDRAFEV